MVCLKNLAVLAAALLPAAFAAPAPKVEAAASNIVEGSYIVKLRSGLAKRDLDAHVSWVSDVHKRDLDSRELAGVENTFSLADFNGYAGKFSAATVAELEASADVSAPSHRPCQKEIYF